MPFSVIVNAAWKPDYQIQLEISNCAEVLSARLFANASISRE